MACPFVIVHIILPILVISVWAVTKWYELGVSVELFFSHDNERQGRAGDKRERDEHPTAFVC
ncbi:hypothetical protein GOC67_27160 [Sinorhizobium medicae]|nr:hypothetical protein [Sinorhizobium medicae]MDX1176573.1 hypothetical protein [Sinorhizobium medicae]